MFFCISTQDRIMLIRYILKFKKNQKSKPEKCGLYHASCLDYTTMWHIFLLAPKIIVA